MTPITPIKAPALADLRNALQLAVTYGDKDVADSEAKQALDRIRGLVALAIGKLGEPNEASLRAARIMMLEQPYPTTLLPEDEPAWRDRQIRDMVALVLHAAVTGELAGESFVGMLPCPGCDGLGQIGDSIPCDQCKGAGKL